MAEETKNSEENQTAAAVEDCVKAEVEEVSPCKKLMKVSVTGSYMTEKTSDAYEELKKSAVVPGFRRGKAPIKLLERKFGKEIGEQVQEDVIGEAYEQVLDNNGFTPVGQPQVDNVETAEDKTLSFEVSVEVRPEFELGEYKDIKLEKLPEEVNDEDIDEGIEALRKQRAELVTEEGAKTKEGDYVLAEMKIMAGDDVIADEKEQMVPVQKGRMFNVEVDFVKLLKNAKAGDEKSTTITLPDDYEKEEHAGKKADVTITVKEVKVQKLPELDEEFLKGLGFEDMESLREGVKRHAEASKKAASREDLESRIFDKLLEDADFDIPEGLLEQEESRTQDDMRRRMYYRGVPPKVIEERLEEMKDTTKEESRKRIKAGFILDKIAEKEKVVATEDEVDKLIESMAAEYRQKPDDVRKRLDKSGGMANLRSQIKKEKTVQIILDKADIKKKKGKKK